MTPTLLSPDLQSNRAALRHVTRPAHDAAERRWFAASAFASKADYLRWLAAMAEVHETIGRPAAERLAGANMLRVEARRLDALKRDLPDGAADESGRRAPASTSQAWGALYVLNGSAMGASMLMKPGTLPNAWPRAYLTEMKSYATSGQLKTFFDELNHADLNLVEAATGARDVFETLE